MGRGDATLTHTPHTSSCCFDSCQWAHIQHSSARAIVHIVLYAVVVRRAEIYCSCNLFSDSWRRRRRPRQRRRHLSVCLQIALEKIACFLSSRKSIIEISEGKTRVQMKTDIFSLLFENMYEEEIWLNLLSRYVRHSLSSQRERGISRAGAAINSRNKTSQFTHQTTHTTYAQQHINIDDRMWRVAELVLIYRCRQKNFSVVFLFLSRVFLSKSQRKQQQRTQREKEREIVWIFCVSFFCSSTRNEKW